MSPTKNILKHISKKKKKNLPKRKRFIFHLAGFELEQLGFGVELRSWMKLLVEEEIPSTNIIM